MKEIVEIREIQEIQLGALRHLKAICERHGLTFFLSNGTLLGAVKYKKFIPWDDDIYVFMPRKDYDRLTALSDIDSDVYRLFNRERCPEWVSTYSKLCDMRTKIQEGSADLGADYGVAMDIFPLDSWCGGRKAACRQAAHSSLLLRCLCASCEQSFHTEKTGIRKAILYAIWRYSRLCGTAHFYKGLRRLVQKGSGAQTDYMGCVAWSLYGRREVIPAEVFASTVPVEFEGDSYPAPVGYDQYLRSLYGEYEADPPEEEQHPHHHMTAWWRDQETV